MAGQNILAKKDFMQIPPKEFAYAVDDLRALLKEGDFPAALRGWLVGGWTILQTDPSGTYARLMDMEERLKAPELMLSRPGSSYAAEASVAQKVVEIIDWRREDLYKMHTLFPEIRLRLSKE